MFDCADAASVPPVIASAVSAAKGGRLVVLPTDTVYGIGADASTAPRWPRCWRPRGAAATCRCRCWSAPGTPSTAWSTRCRTAARELIRAFWPGALSLVVRQAPSLQWDLGDADGTVMLRMPLHPVAIELLREVGPMAVSSANISGHPAAITVERRPGPTRRSGRGVPRRRVRPTEQAASTIVDLTGPAPGSCERGRCRPIGSPRCSASTPRHCAGRSQIRPVRFKRC